MASAGSVDEWVKRAIKPILEEEMRLSLHTSSNRGGKVTEPVDSQVNQRKPATYPTANEASPYQQIARSLVFDYVCEHLDKTDKHVTFGFDEVYVVWFTKVLQNWKALVSTTLPDGMYYEVIYDGNNEVAYLDAYKKFDNREIAIPSLRR